MRKFSGFHAALMLLSFFVFVLMVDAVEKDKHEYWLEEEIALLITKAEKEEFLSLNTDEEREKFIDLFWAKRNPTPGAEVNEFKEEWYRRLEYVNKNYTRGPKKGWHSDMGRVYMFFGPPSQTRATAPQVRQEAMGGTQQDPGAQIWIYQPMPDLGLHNPFQVTFKEYQYGFDLDFQTPQVIRRAMEIFPDVVIFNPDIKEVPTRFRFRLDEKTFEGKKIKDFVASENEVQNIPTEWTPLFTQAENNLTHTSFLAKIDGSGLDKKKLKEMTFFGKLRSADGQEEDFIKTVEPEKIKGDTYLAVFGVPADPGKSTYFLGVTDKDKENYSLFKSELDIPDFGDGKLNTSTLILSPEVNRSSPPDDEEFNPYQVGQFKAKPRWGNVFKPSEFLGVLFQVYNAKLVDEKVSLKVEYFISSDEVNYKLNVQNINENMEPGKAFACGTQVPLNPLKPGKYTFKAKVTDSNASASIEKTVDFHVE